MTARNLQPTTWASMSGWMIVFVTLMLSILSVPASARNQPVRKPTYTVLHKFTGGQDGAHPLAALIRDANGNLYGTTYDGGAFNRGVVFKLDSSGKETVLHSFAGGDGMWPEGPLVFDAAGNLYGAAWDGGTPEGGNCYFGCGTIFKIDTTGKYSVMYAFTGGADGANPASSLVLDKAGNVYGTAFGGIRNYGCTYFLDGCGVVFKLDKHGKETVLHTFTNGNDGAAPNGGLVWDREGNLYGDAGAGGTAGYGVIFKLDSAAVETVVYNFTGGTDGGEPVGTLVRDEAGDLYGATNRGGDLSACYYAGEKGCGVIFKVDSSGNETVLYNFDQAEWGTPGGLLRDRAGNPYGVAGIFEKFAMLFKLSANGKFHLLHTFEPQTGYDPDSGVIMDSAGNLYGTTYNGGLKKCDPWGCGVLYKWSP